MFTCPKCNTKFRLMEESVPRNSYDEDLRELVAAAKLKAVRDKDLKFISDMEEAVKQGKLITEAQSKYLFNLANEIRPSWKAK